MAFSLDLSNELDFHRAGKIAGSLFEHFATAKPPPDTCISVNIPALDNGWPRGVRVCPQASHPMEEHYVKQVDEAGRTYYHLDGRLPEKTDDDDSDLAAMLAGFVTLTPLRFNMTDETLLGSVADWGWPQSFA